MKNNEMRAALAVAVEAAKAAGRLMQRHLVGEKKITEQHQHDIKLELDVRCQRTIARILSRQPREIALLGEEGITGDPEAPLRWVVDPIDGTVNFTYGIPHACVSIALQRKTGQTRQQRRAETHETVVGVVYDPFCDELWTAIRGAPAKLNGRVTQVSSRRQLEETIVSIGFSKQKETLEEMLPKFSELVYKVRKIRIMGAAALAMVYVASGRFDAYVETGVRLWDIAAGGLILEMAGGEFWRQSVGPDWRYRICANNGLLRRKLGMEPSRR